MCIIVVTPKQWVETISARVSESHVEIPSDGESRVPGSFQLGFTSRSLVSTVTNSGDW